MSLFQEKLNSLYQRNNKITPLIEGLEGVIPQRTLDNYYVKLKTVVKEDSINQHFNYETISARKQEIGIEALFDPLPNQEPANKTPITRLLIVGGAGIGKSTLMQYIAYKWSQTKLWNDKFEYVYRVSLKTLLNRDWDRSYEHRQKEDDLLKCLVHYHLVAELPTQERKDIHLEDLVWLDKKDKTLLLLDGYDEVAHERKGVYKRLFEDIFNHKNIILTSRPNAVDKEMATKFERKIETVGLDHDGINQYLTWYFKDDQEKGQALEIYLEKNSSIKDICHIPVNIAMVCFIWSKGESGEVLPQVSNLSDLYSEVVNHLGFRYYSKLGSDHELVSKWRGNKISLDELRVLQHIAYKAMTGGGIKVPEGKRLETLIIKGMTKKGDTEDISIQSSINYLSNELKNNMLTIDKVYKYGLLKSEGIFNPKRLSRKSLLREICNFTTLVLSTSVFKSSSLLSISLRN